ncbi:hypothetical protein RQP46_001710 [Phenoliferia psychrophenolica]
MVAPTPVTWPRAPFPSDIATHPILVVDFALVEAGDASEIEKLITAGTTLGFFYLKNHGIDPEPTFGVGETTYALPLDELMKFDTGEDGRTFGYKKTGGTNTDALGNLDSVQFFNISTDDLRAYPEIAHRTYPTTVGDAVKDVLMPFVKQNDRVTDVILGAFEPFLELPAGSLKAMHERTDSLCESEVRVIYKPAPISGAFAAPIGADGKVMAAIGSHTDIGSFTIIHGRGTGGLQVLPPGAADWHWVLPIEGHVICNIADTLSVFSGGILRSNTHRVVPAPGEQGLHDRWSLGYFLRPSYASKMYPLSHMSAKIKAAADTSAMISELVPDQTCGDYIRRRGYLSRTANRTEGSWKAYAGVSDHTRHRDDL